MARERDSLKQQNGELQDVLKQVGYYTIHHPYPKPLFQWWFGQYLKGMSVAEDTLEGPNTLLMVSQTTLGNKSGRGSRRGALPVRVDRSGNVPVIESAHAAASRQIRR